MIQITSITRGYRTYKDRERAIKLLRRRGFDHFVRYRDTAAEYALCYGVQEDRPPKNAAPFDIEAADGQWVAECPTWADAWTALNTLLVTDGEPGPLRLSGRCTTTTWTATLSDRGHVVIRR